MYCIFMLCCIFVDMLCVVFNKVKSIMFFFVVWTSCVILTIGDWVPLITGKHRQYGEKVDFMQKIYAGVPLEGLTLKFSLQLIVANCKQMHREGGTQHCVFLSSNILHTHSMIWSKSGGVPSFNLHNLFRLYHWFLPSWMLVSV